VRGDVRDRPRRRVGAHAGAVALAVAIVVGAVAGCGGGGDATTSSSSARSKKAGEPGPAAGLSPATRREFNRVRRKLKPPRTPAERVQGAVNGVLTLAIPAMCSPPFVTRRYLEAAYGGRQGCLKAQAPGSVADKLDFKDLRINGSRATAVVVPSGGPYNGERLTVSLVHDGPRWAVDELNANVPVGP
jgi:hypothetical protein